MVKMIIMIQKITFHPALIKKIIEAISKNKGHITLWGNGKSLREVIFSEDVALACNFFLKKLKRKFLILVLV